MPGLEIPILYVRVLAQDRNEVLGGLSVPLDHVLARPKHNNRKRHIYPKTAPDSVPHKVLPDADCMWCAAQIFRCLRLFCRLLRF